MPPIRFHCDACSHQKWKMHSPNFCTLKFSAIGIFGAFFLLLLIVSDVIPQALTSIPVFGVYLLINMTLVVLAMFFNALVSSLHQYPEQKEMPQWLKWVSDIFQFLATTYGKVMEFSLNGAELSLCPVLKSLWGHWHLASRWPNSGCSRKRSRMTLAPCISLVNQCRALRLIGQPVSSDLSDLLGDWTAVMTLLGGTLV